MPETLRLPLVSDPHWARPSIEQRLAIGGITLHSWWSFEAPEWFTGPAQLYDFLAWGWTTAEVPAFTEAQPSLEQIFADYGSPQGVELRHRRYLWKVVAPG